MGHTLAYPRVAKENDDLTPRLRQVCRGVWQEKGSKEIAYELGIAEVTVKVYIHRIFFRLHARNRIGVALWWERNRIRLEGRE
jgi:DNA-binding NarL/FixJ family response regulator